MQHSTVQLIEKFKSSGLTQKAFCARHKIADSTFYYHISKYRKQTSKKKGISSASFVPLHINKAATHSKDGKKTVLLISGDITTADIAELYRMVSH